MKEYTYTNKAYLGIKEGVVPPAPQYLWLNSKDDKLYKFGDNGWEGINNDNLYVADFTIEDLESLSASTLSMRLNARALINALGAQKAIGVRQTTTDTSMSIASAYRDTDGNIPLTVISGNGTMYKVTIECSSVERPEVADNESGIIYFGNLQSTTIPTSFVPFRIIEVVVAVESGGRTRVRKDDLMAILETNEPLFIKDGLTGVVPVSYSITKQGGNPSAIDIVIVYNNGLYHIHWDITDDNALILSPDTVSYTPFSDVYIVTEFTVADIVARASRNAPTLTISRAFLNAMYKGAPIMVKVDPRQGATVPITIDAISDPSQGTTFQFSVNQSNKNLLVRCRETMVITGNKTLEVMINSYDLVDWNENDPNTTGYIANRTHHLGYRSSSTIGQRISVTGYGTYLNNYKVLYEGKFYDLPPLQQGQAFDIAGYFRLIFNGYHESANLSTFTFMSEPISQTLPSQTFVICSDVESEGHKTLDDIFLPDGAKPWKTINVTHNTEGGYSFKNISEADIANGDNVIKNKIIYSVGDDGGQIFIKPGANDSVIEFKIRATGIHNIIVAGSKFWENGERPNVSDGDEVIYSFLVVNGVTYASAKVFRSLE